MGKPEKDKRLAAKPGTFARAIFSGLSSSIRVFWRSLVALLALCCLLILMLGVALGIAKRHASDLAEAGFRYFVPGMDIEIGEINIVSPEEVAFQDVTLGSGKKPLASFKQILIRLNPIDLASRKITQVTLVEPELHLSPNALDFPGHDSKRGEPQVGEPSTGGGWSIGTLECSYGTLEAAGLGHPDLTIDAKYSFRLQDVSSDSPHPLDLTFWEVHGASSDRFLDLDLVNVRFSPSELRAGRIDALSLKGGIFRIGPAVAKLLPQDAAEQGTAVRAKSEEVKSKFSVGELSLEGLKVDIDDQRQLATAIAFTLNTKLSDVSLGQAASSIGEEIQTIEISDVEFLSPYDPLAKVLTISQIQVDFTLAGLVRQQLVGIRAVRPLIYVGPDLFWYMDEAQRQASAVGGGDRESSSSWVVQLFELIDGKLVLGSGGRASLGLPLSFHTRIQNVALDDLASLHGEGALEVPAQNYDFPAYQLEFTTRGGELRFAYPPDKNMNNLVGTLKVEVVRWRQFEVSDAWVSVTFDRNGINGDAGGRAYGGYLTAGASFFFQPDSPWIGWTSGDQISLKKLTDVLAPENFQMTGPADFRLQVDAQRQVFRRVKGSLQATKPGTLHITKLDEMLKNIPGDWPELNAKATKLALEALREFPYESCTGDLWLVDLQGQLELKLAGPTGHREFDVFFHNTQSDGSHWTLKSTSDTP